MIFHTVLAGIQLLALIGIGAWQVIAYTSPNYNPLALVIDIPFWTWWALSVSSKMMLIAWKVDFRRLSKFSTMAFIAFLIASIWVAVTLPTRTPSAISLGDFLSVLGFVACVNGDFFYWLLPLSGLTAPAMGRPESISSAD